MCDEFKVLKELRKIWESSVTHSVVAQKGWNYQNNNYFINKCYKAYKIMYHTCKCKRRHFQTIVDIQPAIYIFVFKCLMFCLFMNSWRMIYVRMRMERFIKPWTLLEATNPVNAIFIRCLKKYMSETTNFTHNMDHGCMGCPNEN